MVTGLSGISISWYGDPILAERLLADLDMQSRKRLGTIMHSRHYNQGQTIFSSESVPSEVIVLKKGTAELVNPSGSRSVAPGEVLGLTETLAEAKFQDTLTAVSDCEISVISRDDLIWYLRHTPEACYRSLEVVAETFHHARERAVGDN